MNIQPEHVQALTGYVVRRIGQRYPHLVGDIVQSALLKAWKSRKNYTEEGKLKGWLCTIAHNELINTLRKKKEAPPGYEDYYSDVQAERILPQVEKGMPDWVVETFEALKPHHQEVLRLRALDFTYKEIAEKLGVPETTATNRLYRARQEFIELAGEKTLEDVDFDDFWVGAVQQNKPTAKFWSE